MKFTDKSYLPKYLINEIISTLKECDEELKKHNSENSELINKTEFLHDLLIQRILQRD